MNPENITKNPKRYQPGINIITTKLQYFKYICNYLIANVKKTKDWPTARKAQKKIKKKVIVIQGNIHAFYNSCFAFALGGSR